MIFEQIAPPLDQSGLPIDRCSDWYTWSPAFRRVLKSWSHEIKTLPPPRLLRILGGEPYDETFSLPLSSLPDAHLVGDLMFFARSLYYHPIPKRILLFSGLMDAHLDSDGLHYLFAFFRDALVHLAQDQMGALYAPLGSVGRNRKEFPLHADLYVPELLFNVFDEVPLDSSGKSLFLRLGTFRRLIRQVGDIPRETCRKIDGCFQGGGGRDRYEEFFDLVYGLPYCWRQPLEESMQTATLRIKLRAGQGYLIHDRAWLHGREAPTGGVSPRRVHRLVFNPHAVACASRRIRRLAGEEDSSGSHREADIC